jgi:hypothetical protein
LASSSLHAGTINHNDVMGTSVLFSAISETDNSPGNDGAAFFNQPTASGNSLDFNPTDFDASASNGAPGSDLTDVQLNFMITSKPGNSFGTITLTESGDYSIFSGSGNNAFVSVVAPVFIDIVEVDGAALSTPVNLMLGMTFNGGGVYQTAGGLPVDGTFTGTLNVDLLAELASRNISVRNGVTKANVALDNRLRAIAASGSDAFIAKKDADGGVRIIIDQNEIPEPATLVLVGLSLAAFAVARRR